MKNIFTAVAITALLFVVAACGHHHDDTQSHHHCTDEHHHENTVIQLVEYGKQVELFAEITPLSVKDPCQIQAYITLLQDFKPLKEGTVTAQLSIGEKCQKVSVFTPTQSGVYHLSLTPAVVGTGTLTFFIKNNELVDTLVFNNLTVFEDAHEALHHVPAVATATPTAIVFPKSQSWQIDFATDCPQLRPFGHTVQTVAQVQPAQGDELTIVAKTSGVLTLATNILEGSAVAAGSSIATITSHGFIDDNLAVRIAEAKNNFETAQANYERAKTLVDRKIVAQQEFLELKNQYQNAKIVYENLKENVQNNHAAVTTHIRGFIKRIFVSNGAYVIAGQPIITIVQNKNIVLKAEIPPRYATILPSIATATIENPVTHEVENLSELNGRILSYGRTVAADNFMIPVTLEINNIGDFTAGTFVNVWLSAQTSGEALVIPKSALMEEQGNYYVFVQITPELFDKKAVTIGATDGKWVEICSGIDKTQRIVTRGGISVKLAKSAGALDPHAGHVH